MTKKAMFRSLVSLIFIFSLAGQVKADGLGGIYGVAGSWDPNTEPDLAGYWVYIASTYDNISSKVGDIAEFSTEKTCFCYYFDEPCLYAFFGVTALDDQGRESDITIGYMLYGNIWGDYHDGVPWNEAILDGQDLTTLGFYFSLLVTHQEIDCAGIFVVEIPGLGQRSDINKDDEVTGLDLIEFGINYTNTIEALGGG